MRASGHDVTVLSPPDGGGDLRAPFLGGRAFLRASRVGRGFDRVIVHFQPALYYRPRAPLSKVLTSLAFLWLALTRAELEVVVHEADPPVRWRPDYLLLALAMRSAARVSFHTQAELDRFRRDYRVAVRGRVIPHRVRAASRVERDQARSRLGIENGSGPVFVAPGFIQPSKGLDRAVAAFATAGEGSLFVVGSVREETRENLEYLQELRDRCRSTPGVTLVERFVSDDEFDLWVSAADWVVLPYRRSWSSGVLARAHQLGTPSIISAVGGLPEQASGEDVVVGDDAELARALERATAASGDGGGGPPHHYKAHHHAHVPDTLAEWDPDLETPTTKKGRNVLIGLILISVLLAALAQLTLKHGMNQVTHHGELPLSLRSPGTTFVRIASNISVWAGLLTFVASASVWLVILSRTSLSFAYPFASLTYVLILLFDRLVLHEPVSVLRWGGVALIVGGLLLISRTHHA